MSNPVKNIFSLPKGMLLFLAIYALSFPIFLTERLAFHSDTLARAVALSPALVWKGQLWRLVTFELFAAGAWSWVVNSFWFATLMLVLARSWSSFSFWMFALFTSFAGALPVLLAFPKLDAPLFGGGALVFGLLVAWVRLYGRERLIMVGLGEMSVRQAAGMIAGINLVISFFAALPCGGIWIASVFTFSLVCGGLAGWAYLAIGDKRVMSRGSQTVKTERMARLEL